MTCPLAYPVKFPVLGLGHTICVAVTVGSVARMGMEKYMVIITMQSKISILPY